MKKIATASLIAIALSGCGMVATSSNPAATASSSITSQSSLLSVLGLDETDSSTPADASGSVKPIDRGELLFTLLDTDGDGSIMLDELSAVIKAHKASLSDVEIKAMFDQLDRNGDSAITLDELQPAEDQGRGGCGSRRPEPRGGHEGRHGGRFGGPGFPPPGEATPSVMPSAQPE